MKPTTLILVMVIVLAGCAASEPPPPPDTAPPPGVSVSLGQWRSDEPVHRMQVAVRNTTDTPVYFADAQLVTPSFATLPPEKIDSTVKRTERTDLQIPYGAANCSPQGLPEVQPATVVAHISTGSEPPRKVVFPLGHPDPLLARLLRDECTEFLIKQVVSIEFGPEWKMSGKVMRGDLVVTRHRPGTVALNEMGGTTHYNVTTERKTLGVLDATAQRLEAPIELTPARCDPHSLGEAKKAFLFPVRVSIDGGEEQVITVVPPKPLQNRLIAYVLEACGLS